MKFKAKTKAESKIPTSSMPDIIFMLLIFFMVTTVLREYEGLNVFLPQARKIERLESKRHTSHVFISKDGLISIDDKIIPNSITVFGKETLRFFKKAKIQKSNFILVERMGGGTKK